MESRYVSITFLQEPRVGVATPAVVTGPPGTWGGAGEPFPTPPIPIYPGGTPNPPIIWGPPGPWPTPPIAGIPGLPGYEPPRPTLPPASAGWRFNDGWYFVWGPFDKPRPLGDNSNLDPIKTDWKTMDGMGWWFVSGPYDKPIPIFGTPPPDIEEPPTMPPAEGDWVYNNGWYFTYGPLPKPGPIPGNGNGGNGGNVPPE